MSTFNVLVVDDDEAIRALLLEYLGQQSHVSVDAARDGVEALHQIAVNRYRVIVLDVVMPKMSGVDLLNSLEAMMNDESLPSFEYPPVVLVITATPASELPRESLEGRYPTLVHAVFRKPLDVAQLGTTVRQFVGSA